VSAPRLVTDGVALASLVLELASAARIALDVEADGLFAYRAKLCIVQLAWEGPDGLAIAIVDPLAIDVRPLAPVLGAAGPPKVLHDLTFDARMLAEAGIQLGHAWDTSVAARFLGEPATGLARMVESRVGVVLAKDLQDHDWSRRPLGESELGYLAADVRHLLPLAHALEEEARSRGIDEEVALECDYKLATALRPPKDERPLHARIKGFGELDPVGRSVLRRLVEARESLAEEADVPPFRIARSDTLLELARAKPTSERDLRRICGRDRAARHSTHWQRAVALGVEDEPEPRPPSPTPPPDLAERRAAERTLTAWRRARAEERGVDPQVVIPGHCVDEVLAALFAKRREGTPLEDSLASIEGFGATRVARYSDALRSLLAPEG